MVLDERGEVLKEQPPELPASDQRELGFALKRHCGNGDTVEREPAVELTA